MYDNFFIIYDQCWSWPLSWSLFNVNLKGASLNATIMCWCITTFADILVLNHRIKSVRSVLKLCESFPQVACPLSNLIYGGNRSEAYIWNIHLRPIPPTCLCLQFPVFLSWWGGSCAPQFHFIKRDGPNNHSFGGFPHWVAARRPLCIGDYGDAPLISCSHSLATLQFNTRHPSQKCQQSPSACFVWWVVASKQASGWRSLVFPSSWTWLPSKCPKNNVTNRNLQWPQFYIKILDF